MNSTENKEKEYYVIDIMHIIRSVWHRIWVVIIAVVIGAVMGFSYANFMIAPSYSSSVLLYVNNTSFNMGDLGFSISASDITAAQSLTKTYTVMLKNRTTLQRLVAETGTQYSWGALYGMIHAAPVDNTEIMRITVTCDNPYEAEKLANGIAKVLPQRVSEIIEGASMEVVDSAVANTNKVGPSVTRYTIVGFVLGAIVSVVLLALIALLDKTIHDEEYVINNYGYPILAKIPNLTDASIKKYRYYYKRRYYKSSSSK